MVSELPSISNGPIKTHGPGTLRCLLRQDSHFTLTEPVLFIQVYKWVPADLMLGCNPAMDYNHRQKSWDKFTFVALFQTREFIYTFNFDLGGEQRILKRMTVLFLKFRFKNTGN